LANGRRARSQDDTLLSPTQSSGLNYHLESQNSEPDHQGQLLQSDAPICLASCLSNGRKSFKNPQGTQYQVQALDSSGSFARLETFAGAGAASLTADRAATAAFFNFVLLGIHALF
jgi:hypothetical protein